MLYEQNKVDEIFKGLLQDADTTEKTPLHLAAEKGNTKVVKWLLNQGVDLEKRDNSNNRAQDLAKEEVMNTFLEYASRHGTQMSIYSFFRIYVDKPQAPQSNQFFLLFEDNIFKLANTNVNGKNLFHIIAAQGNLVILKRLFNAIVKTEPKLLEAIMNSSDLKEGKTPLHFAAQEGHHEIVTWLMDLKIDEIVSPLSLPTEIQIIDSADLPNHLGRTPLHLAAQNGHTEIIKKIMTKNNFTLLDYQGNTPLHLAIKNSAPNIIDIVNEILGQQKVGVLTKQKIKAYKTATSRSIYGAVENRLKDLTPHIIKATSLLLGTLLLPILPTALYLSSIVGYACVWYVFPTVIKKAGQSLFKKTFEDKTSLLEIRNYVSQDTILHLAAKHGDIRMLNAIFTINDRQRLFPESNRYYIMLPNSDGETSLHTAAKYNTEKFFNTLKIYAFMSTNPQERSRIINTALNAAAYGGKKDLVKELIETEYAGTQQPGLKEPNAFYVAIKQQHFEIVKYFIKRFPDQIETFLGQTALKHAKKNRQIHNYLLQKKTDFIKSKMEASEQELRQLSSQAEHKEPKAKEESHNLKNLKNILQELKEKLMNLIRQLQTISY